MRGKKSSAHALLQSVYFYSPVGEQENKVLSFQEQTSKDQITDPWDLTNHPLYTASLHQPSSLEHSCKRAAVVQAPLHSGAASLGLQLKWFSKESTCGRPNQLFPSSQQ